ncbi:hypothetical protein [Arthrobacter crystallopoietes]|uniref:hypothetical protein n=1 Tax=Crystallibacter crystallopoietes TaxID=37928 RepID=UPI001ABEBCA5|nr:hypothetical protein [Arthrobacter crystallopoietes]QTG83248.1 hypothetical protein J5251_12410 [Arthrobacter crystallopoietes]
MAAPTDPRTGHAHTDPGPLRNAVGGLPLALVRHAMVSRYDGAAQRLSARRAWAAELARFVDGFQQLAPADAPANPVRGVPLHRRNEQVRRRRPTSSRGAGRWQR